MSNSKSFLSWFVTDDPNKKDPEPALTEAEQSTVQGGMPPTKLNLNFNYLPSPNNADQAEQSQSEPQNPAFTPSQMGENEQEVIEAPQRDIELDKLIAQLSERVRKDAGIGYAAFAAKRREILAAASDTPLKVILIAAGVKSGEMLQEIAVLKTNLDAAVAETEAETEHSLGAEIAQCESDFHEAKARAEESRATVEALTQQLRDAQATLAESQSEAVKAETRKRQLITQQRVLSQRLSRAKVEVLRSLSLEEREFKAALPQTR